MKSQLITIAGGGLAGLSLGIALRQREIPVRVIELETYPRHRVCGEFVSGISSGELAALGIVDVMRPAVHQRQLAWFDDRRLLLRQQLPEEALGLSRYHLDHALADVFKASGGELQTGSRFTGRDGEEGLVVATGRAMRSSPWLGVKAHYHDLALEADLEIHFSNSAYVGLTRIENGAVNVCGLFRQTGTIANTDGTALLGACRKAGLSGLADRLASAKQVPGSLKGVHRLHLGWQKMQDETMRIGDAAVIIPPFTGNGMTMAMQSALAAVEPLTAWSHGQQTWRASLHAVRAAQSRRFAHRLRWAHWMQAWLMNPWGRTICTAMLRSGVVSFETLYRQVR